MHSEEVIIPVAFFASVFGIFAFYFTTRNRERMALIEKGADPSLFHTRSRGRFSLKLGLMSVGIALGILIGQILHATVQGLPEEVAVTSMIFFWGGSALIVSHILERREEKAGEAGGTSKS